MTGPRKTAVNTEVDEKKDEPEFIEPVAPEAVAPKDEPSENPDNDPVEEPVSDNPDEVEPEPEWFPGRPCLNCGARDYKWTVGWGGSCSQCAPENQTEDGDE